MRIDTRLPLVLFKREPFVYTGLNFKSFPCGIISGVVNFSGRQFERFYPLTVSETDHLNRIRDQMFCFSLFYINDQGDLVLFLTQSRWLVASISSSVLDFFIANMEEFARQMNSRFLEVEFHSEVTSTISFPTSLTHFSYELSDTDVRHGDLSFLKKHGFTEKATLYCYEKVCEIKTKDIEDLQRAGGGYTIADMDSNEFIALKEEADEFSLRASRLPAGEPHLAVNDAPLLLDRAVVAYHGKEFTGYLRWLPNLFESAKTHVTPIPLLFRYVLDNFSFKHGKIFDWGLKTKDEALLASLISNVENDMQQKGLKRYQMAYIDGRQHFIRKFLENRGFRRVHTLKLLRKRVG